MNSPEHRGKEIQSQIREILFRDWDPVPVNYNASLRDEYDSYITPIYRELVGARSSESLLAFLTNVESDLGCTIHKPEELRAVVTKLLAIDVNGEDRAA
jgi:hypothetical protein